MTLSTSTNNNAGDNVPEDKDYHERVDHNFEQIGRNIDLMANAVCGLEDSGVLGHLFNVVENCDNNDVLAGYMRELWEAVRRKEAREMAKNSNDYDEFDHNADYMESQFELDRFIKKARGF